MTLMSVINYARKMENTMQDINVYCMSVIMEGKCHILVTSYLKELLCIILIMNCHIITGLFTCKPLNCCDPIKICLPFISAHFLCR